MRRCAASMIRLNEYLSIFLVLKASDKICDMKLDSILFNSMTNGWSNQAYVQGFDFETIMKKYVNMFERMEVYETIRECVV